MKMGKSKWRYHFDSFSDFLDACKKPRNSKCDDPSSDRRGESTTEFTGTKNFEEAEYMAINGDPDALRRVRELSEVINANIEGSYKEALTSYETPAGDLVNIDAFLMGEADNMFAYEYNITRGSKIVSIAVNLAVHCGISGQALLNRGSALCTLVDILEKSGYRLEIQAVESTRGGGAVSTTSIVVKSAEQPLDITRLAYSIGHPSMLRRHWFRFAETWSDWEINNITNRGYGSPDEDIEAADCDLYIGAGDVHRFEDKTYCEQWVRLKCEEITKQTNR